MLEVPLLNQKTNRSPMASNTRYWTGLDELDATESYRTAQLDPHGSSGFLEVHGLQRDGSDACRL